VLLQYFNGAQKIKALKYGGDGKLFRTKKIELLIMVLRITGKASRELSPESLSASVIVVKADVSLANLSIAFILASLEFTMFLFWKSQRVASASVSGKTSLSFDSIPCIS